MPDDHRLCQICESNGQKRCGIEHIKNDYLNVIRGESNLTTPQVISQFFNPACEDSQISLIVRDLLAELNENQIILFKKGIQGYNPSATYQRHVNDLGEVIHFEGPPNAQLVKKRRDTILGTIDEHLKSIEG